MKLKIFATISYKNKTFIVSLFLIYAMLLNSYAGLNYTEIKINKKKLTTTITPSIAAAADELFLGEQTVITFEGFDGDPLHTFTYTLNGGSDETISTTNDENSVTLNTSIISLGTFTYTLIKVEDSFGNIEIVDQDLTITVTDPPTISFVFTNDGACSNETIDFTSSVSGDGPFSYKWDFGDGNTSTDENPSHAYNTTGNIGLQDFSVKLLVTDNNTRASSVSEVVSIQNIPNISFFSGGSLKNCAIQEDGFDVEFFNSSQSSSDITSYTFDWGDGSSETISGADFPVNSNGISHTFEIGVFTVVISAKNSDGCSNEVEFDVIYGNDPGGGLQAPPNTAGICFPTEELDFGIVGWGENSKETTYELDFGDGTIVNYTQTLLENSSSYNATDPSKSSVFSTLHIYTSGSCSEVNGEFIVKLTITNACNNKISTANNVVILEPSVPLFEVDPVGCVNVPLEFDNQSIIGDDADCAENARFQWDWGDGNVQNFPPGSTADNQTHTYTAPGNYKVILSVFGVCDTDNTYERTICIEPEKEITASYILDFQEGCILPLAVSTENTIDESELCSGPTYNWTVTFEDINCNTLSDWEFTDSTNASSENPKFLFNNPGNYTITQNVTTGCGSFSTQKVITIKKPPTVSINPIDDFCKPAIISPVAVVENCTDNLGGVTYNWTFSGGTPATSTLQNPENISYDTEGTFTVTLEVTNECGVSNTATQQFEVLEKPIITNSPTTQEICSNQSTTPISLTASNTNSSFIWTATTLPNNPNITGFTSNGTSQVIPSQTIVNSGFTPGSIVYTVTPDLNGCLGDLVEVLTVIVNPTPIITTQPIPSNICLDGAANTLEIVTENGVGTPNYQWYASSTNTYDLSNPITGATNSTYDPATNTVGEVFYFVVISFDGGCSDIQSTITLVNTVAEPTANAVNPEQTICVDGQADMFTIDLLGGLGNPTFQWFSNTKNTNTGGTAISDATSNTYDSGVFSSIGTFYYYLEATLDGTGCDLASSDVFAVNVVADPVIDTQAIASQEVCRNTTLEALEVVVSGNTNTGDFSYQWFSNTTNNNSGGTLIGTNTNTYTPDNSTVGSFFYYVVINQTASGCEVTSEVSTIIINEGPTITTQPVGSDICLDGAANVLEVVTENGVGTPTYQWYASSTNTYDVTNPIAGATNSRYIPTTNTVGEVFYFVVISFEGGCSDIQSTIALVNTVAEPIATAVNPEQTICLDGQADTFTINLVGGLGNPTYQWFSNTTNTNSGGTAIAGATNSTYDNGVLSTIGAFYYYIEVTLDGTGCDLATSDVFTVNVVADPIIDTQAMASQEICQNTILEALEVVVSGNTNTGDFSYQWFSNTTNTNSGGTAIASATSKVYNPDNITVGTFFYYVVIKQTASGCEVTSEVSTIIINEGPSITTQPIPSDICLDGAANVLEVVTQNGVGTPTYQWFSNTTNSITGATEVTGATNSTYTPPTNTVGEVFYFVIIAFDGGCSDIQSDIVLVKVNQIPVIDFAEITIYSEETFLFDPSSIASNIIPAGTTYTWTTPTSSTPGAILGSSAESSPQTNISQTLENTDIFPAIETYIITPATTNCAGNPFTLEVTVNPKIIPNVLVTNNTCFESNDGIITTNITGGVPFTTGTSYLISWTGPNSFTSTASSISNLIAGIYILRIEDSNGVFITEQYTVTQPDLLIITTDLEQNISCFEGSDGAIEVSASGGTLSYTFNWTTTDGTGIIQGNEGQSGLTAGTYNLELTDNNACVNAKTFILTEPKAIGSTVLKEDILCFGDATGAIEIAVTGGTPIEVSSGVFEYTYSWLGPNGFTSNVQNISNLFAGIYTIEITDNLGCIERTDIVLTEPTAIEINYTKTDIACYGETDGAIDVTISGGNPPYQISWSNLANGFSQSNLSAGSYVAKIVDENKCEANVTITIEQPIFFIEPIVIPISCNNENDGSIDLNLTGGIAPITVLWSDNPSAGLQRNNLSPGTYSVTITDSDPNQCPIQQTFLFTDPPAIGVSETITDATDCSIVNSGSILLDVSGGTPPYDFIWNTGQTTEDLTNIPPGDYSVEIKDKNNCIINKQFSIYRQEPIEIEFLVTEIPDCDLKTVSQRTVAKITGGISPYTYSWSAGSVSITDNTIMTTSQNGLYTLTITDDKGCTESKIFLVDLPTIGNADYSYDAFSIDNYNLLSIEDPIQFTNLTIGNYSNITWDFGDGSPTTSDENPVHIYDQVGVFNVVLKIELDFGCIAIIEKTLNITQGYVLINPNAFSPNNDGYNETIRPSFTGFKEIEMTIYDTWGVPIYYEKNLELNGWDGTIKGLPAENGNYVMVVKGNTFYEKEIITITALTLLK